MKRIVSSIAWIFLLFVLVRFPPVVFAACVRSDTAASCPKDKPFFTPYTLSYPTDPKSTNPFQSADPSCTHPVVPSGTKTGACCTEKNEANAKDSIRAPLCGASAELDKTNSTCWDCGGLIACSGYDQALGQTDPKLTADREKIGEDDISRLWRVPAENRPPGTFLYNGIEYYAGGKDIIMCGPNLPACMQPACSNMIHPEVQSSGKADETLMCTRADPVTGSAATTSACQDETGNIDLTPYIAPKCDGGTCDGVAGSAFPKEAAHVGNVNNQGETVTINGKTYFKQKSNGQHLLYEVDGKNIKLVQDTTWANSVVCVIGGKVAGRAVNRPSGATGAGVVAYGSSMQCGGTVTSSGKVQGYLYDPKIDAVDGELGSLTACEQSYDERDPNKTNIQGGWGSTTKLLYQGPSQCMGQSKEIVVLQVVGGGGAGEVFVYCKDQGLCAWYQGIDFSKPENNPSGFGARDMCAGGPVGGQCVPIESVGDLTYRAPFQRIISGILGPLLSLTEDIPFLGQLIESQVSYAGQVWPQADTYHSVALDRLNTQLSESSFNDLNPDWFQRNTTHETPKQISATSRMCVYDPITGELVGDFISKERFITEPVTWTTMNEPASRLNSMVGRETTGTDFETSSLLIKTGEPRPCDVEDTGVVQDPDTLASTQRNTYGQGSNPGSSPAPTNVLGTGTQSTADPGTATVNVKTSVTRDIISIVDGIAKWTLNIPAHINFTQLLPNMPKAWCALGGCDPADVEQAEYLSSGTKSQMIDNGGFFETFKPAGMEFRPPVLHGQYENQAFDQNIFTPIGVLPVNTNQYLTNAIEKAGNFGNCSILPNDLQGNANYFPGGECNEDWTLGAESSRENDGTKPTPSPATFGSLPTTTPKAGGWNCNANAAAQSVPGLSISGGKEWADNHIYAKTCKTQNAWDMCHNDVIIKAKAACVDPTFTLAIWLHESAASNYACGRELSGGTVQDFGYNVDSTAENFNEQLKRFLTLPDAYASRCPKTMQNFIAQFWFGPTCYDDIDLSEKAKVNLYIDELNKIYDYLAPGVSLPTWPETTNCSK